MNRKKFKPTMEQLEQYKIDCDNFRNEITDIEKEFKVNIVVNSKCNSIYFTHKDIDYRISTHSKIDKGDFNNYGKFDGVNTITNSRKHILKYLRDILQG